MPTNVLTPTQTNLDQPQFVAAKLYTASIINADAIRDTATHDPTTGDAAIQLADLRGLPGQKVMYVTNTTTQSATLFFLSSVDGVNVQQIGSSKTLAAGVTAWYDGGTYGSLDKPYPYWGMSVSFAVAPVSGVMTAILYARSN